MNKLKKIVNKVLLKRSVYSLTVDGIERLSPNMMRFIFYVAPTGLSKAHEGGYLKLEFQQADGKTRMRSYTIRKVLNDGKQIVIDFVDHGDSGLASAWANQAQVGQALTARGPGAAKNISESEKHCIIVGDASSLPAIAVTLSCLSAEVQGHCLIHLLDEQDKQSLPIPDGVDMHWVIAPNQQQAAQAIVAQLEALNIPSIAMGAWVAGEFEVALAARKYLQAKVDLGTTYFSSYWKVGVTDDLNKQAKAEEGGFS